MAVYNKNGIYLQNVYQKNGSALDYAYNKAGSVVFQNEINYDYDDYTVSGDLFGLSGSSFQGFAVHNGKIAQFQADDKVTIVSVDGTTIASQMYIKSYHGQSAFFLNDYYTTGDEFPLLLVMGSYTNAWINRLTRTGTTLVKTLYMPTTVQNGGYKLGNAYNSANNHMFTFGYTEQNYETDSGGLNKLIIAEWNLSNLTDNGDSTFTPELISTVQRDFIVCIQGSCYFDGMLWATSGIGGSASHVFAFDPQTAEILHTVTLSNVEVEGCAWVGNEYMIVGQNPSNIAYKKVTFAEA